MLYLFADVLEVSTERTELSFYLFRSTHTRRAAYGPTDLVLHNSLP